MKIRQVGTKWETELSSRPEAQGLGSLGNPPRVGYPKDRRPDHRLLFLVLFVKKDSCKRTYSAERTQTVAFAANAVFAARA